MPQQLLERRVETLEDLMADLMRAAARTERQFERTDRQLERTSREMAAFKDEMAVFKDNMAAIGERLDAAGKRWEAAGERWDAADKRWEAVVQRLDQSIADAAKDRIERRKEWGELSRRLGTMAEDLVAPSIPRVLRTVIGCPENHVDSYAVRVRKWSRQENREREFDVVATCGDYLLINETKSRLTPKDVTAFVALLPTVREHYFPEHPGKRVIGALASLYVDESLVRHAERRGLIILGFGEDLMDVLNSEGFVPREY